VTAADAATMPPVAQSNLDAIISLRGVTKRFGSHTVLEDITWYNAFRFLGVTPPR